MTDDRGVESLLRSALRPPPTQIPSRDLWPDVVGRISAPVRVSWLDLGLALAVAIALFTFPEWLLPLAFHL